MFGSSFKNQDINSAQKAVNKDYKRAKDIYGSTTGIAMKENTEKVEEAARAISENNKITKEADEVQKQYGETVKKISEDMKQYSEKTYTSSQKMAAWAQVATAALTIANTLSGIFKTLKDDDLTPWDKFKSILTTLITVAPMLITTLSASIPVIFGAGTAAKMAAGEITLLKAAVDLLTGN